MQTRIDRLREYRENPRIGKLYEVVTKHVWGAGSITLTFKIL